MSALIRPRGHALPVINRPLHVAELRGGRVPMTVHATQRMAFDDDEEPVSKDELIDAMRWRPRTRGDCVNGLRPCPWVGCKHNAFLEVSQYGRIRYNHDLAPWDIDPEKSCVLDIAEMGGASMEITADVLGYRGGQGAQMAEEGAYKKLRRRLARVWVEAFK